MDREGVPIVDIGQNGQCRILADWSPRFSDCAPIGHYLRDALIHRWVRFHSLPKSKRWPTNEKEYAEILKRHNLVMGDLASPGDEVVLLTTGYSQTADPVRSYDELQSMDSHARPWRTVNLSEIENDPLHSNFWHVFASKWIWHSGTFDPIVRLIAADSLADIMIVSIDCRWLVHPYDGGMDVILESKTKKNWLKARYPGWLSPRPDGL